MKVFILELTFLVLVLVAMAAYQIDQQPDPKYYKMRSNVGYGGGSWNGE